MFTQAIVCHNLGAIYNLYGDYNKAIEVILKSLQFFDMVMMKKTSNYIQYMAELEQFDTCVS